LLKSVHLKRKLEKCVANQSMADLLAQQSKRVILTRGMEVEGEVIAVYLQEIILDLGAKSEGVLTRKSLPEEQAQNVKVGDKITAFVISPESESGQVVLGMQRLNPKAGVNLPNLRLQ
jgi:ribosomal protein S1